MVIEIRIKTCPQECLRRPRGSLHITIERELLVNQSHKLKELLSSGSHIIELRPHEREYTCQAVEYILNTWKGEHAQPPNGREGCFNVAQALFHLRCSVSEFQHYATNVIDRFFQGDLGGKEHERRYSEKWAFIALVFGRHDVFCQCIRDLKITRSASQLADIPQRWGRPRHESVLGFVFSRDEQVDLQRRASNVVHWYVQKLYRIEGQEKHAQDLRKRLEKKYKFQLPPLGPTTPVASLRNASIQQHSELQGDSEFFQKHTAYHLYIKLWKWFEEEKGKQDTSARGGSMNTFTKDSASHQKQRLFKAVKKWFDEDLIQHLASHGRTSENFESVRESVWLGPTEVLVDHFDNTPDPGQSHRTSVDNTGVFVGAPEGPTWNLPAPIMVHTPIQSQRIPNRTNDSPQSCRPLNRPLPAQSPIYPRSDYALSQICPGFYSYSDTAGSGSMMDAEAESRTSHLRPQHRGFLSPQPPVPPRSRHRRTSSHPSRSDLSPHGDYHSNAGPSGSHLPLESLENTPANTSRAAEMHGALRPEPLRVRPQVAPQERIDPSSYFPPPPPPLPPRRYHNTQQSPAPAPTPTPPRTPSQELPRTHYDNNHDDHDGPPQLPPIHSADPIALEPRIDNRTSYGFEPGENFDVPGIVGFHGGNGHGAGGGGGPRGGQYDYYSTHGPGGHGGGHGRGNSQYGNR